MAEEKTKKKAVAAAAGAGAGNMALLREAIKSSVQDALGGFREELKAMGEEIADVSNRTEELHGLYVINAASEAGDEEDGDLEASGEEDIEAAGDDEIEAAKHDDEEGDDDDGPWGPILDIIDHPTDVGRRSDASTVPLVQVLGQRVTSRF